MRNADETAKRIAKAVMDRIELERAIHLSSIEDEVRKCLAVITHTVRHDPACLMREQAVSYAEEVNRLIEGMGKARSLGFDTKPRSPSGFFPPAPRCPGDLPQTDG